MEFMYTIIEFCIILRTSYFEKMWESKLSYHYNYTQSDALCSYQKILYIKYGFIWKDNVYFNILYQFLFFI